jgi:histone demethylase JARID1
MAMPNAQQKTNGRLFGVVEAPVFRPTAEEFNNPLLYIQSILSSASKFGICKLIPPPEFQPGFAINKGSFEFQTRFQELNSMEGSSRLTLNYTERLIKFHEQQGGEFNIPRIEGKPVDLWLLRKLVCGF